MLKRNVANLYIRHMTKRNLMFMLILAEVALTSCCCLETNRCCPTRPCPPRLTCEEKPQCCPKPHVCVERWTPCAIDYEPCVYE